jgi:hypothetical protein
VGAEDPVRPVDMDLAVEMKDGLGVPPRPFMHPGPCGPSQQEHPESRSGLWALVYLGLRHLVALAILVVRSDNTNEVEPARAENLIPRSHAATSYS